MSGANQVYPGLWVGEKPPQKRLHPPIDALVLAAAEHQPPNPGWGVDVIRCPLPDDRLTLGEIELADRTGDRVAALLNSGKNVLCTCQMGLNRSSLIACIAMGKLGVPPAVAIDRVRHKRGGYAMSNEHFVRYLNSIVLHHALGPGDLRRPGSLPYQDR